MLKEWDRHFVIALLAGGLGIMLYEMARSFVDNFALHIITTKDFNNEIYSKGIAGIAVLIAALIYVAVYRKKENQK